jgi:hypothetical protein
VKVGEPFDRERRGHLRLTRDRTRFSGLPEELHVPIGDGAYGPPEIAEAESDSDGFRPTALMERASRAIEATPGMSRNEVLAATGGKRDYATLAVTLLIADGFVRDEPDGQAKRHYSIRPYRESEEGGEDA